MKKYIWLSRRAVLWLLLLGVTGLLEACYVKLYPPQGLVSGVSRTDEAVEEKLDEREIVQTFRCDRKHMDGVVVHLSCESFTLYTEVYASLTKEDTVLQEWTVVRSFYSDDLVRLVLDRPETDAEGQEYSIHIRASGLSGIPRPVTEEKGPGAVSLTVDGEVQENLSMAYGILYKYLPPGRLFLCVFAFTVFAFGILYWILIIRRKNSEEMAFLLCYVLLGMIYFAAIPVFKVPDEMNHFLRCYEITEGHLLSERNPSGLEDSLESVGRELPVGLALERLNWGNVNHYEIFEMFDLRIDEKATAFQGFFNTALYSPGAYLPQLLGLSIARFFTDRVVVLIYAARFSSWLINGLLICLSIHFLPFGKKLACLIALIPMNLHQMVSLSTDGFLFAVCMGILSFALYQSLGRKDPMKPRHLVLMYLLVALLGQCKLTYVPLGLLLFLIPVERFGSRRAYLGNIVGCTVVGGGISFGWLYLLSAFPMEMQPGVNSAMQQSYLLHAPVDFLLTLLRTVERSGDSWVRSMLGAAMGWLNIPTGFLMITAYMLLLLTCVCMAKDGSIRLTWFFRGMLLLLPCVSALLIFVSLYMKWTVYHAAIIDGVQGRYFLPLLLPACLALKPAGEDRERWLSVEGMAPLAVGINLCIATVLLTHAF